ncbi:MAG TPA: hypothetical protein VK870_06300 [Ignavibacteriaceae bacterium]|nr:hypothetical protein [Ignavibacteriaceae bacterium]
MKKLLIFNLLFLILLSGYSFTQTMRSASGSFNVNISSLYENWSVNDSTELSEISNSLWMSYIIERNTRIALSTKYASVGGDIGSLSGFSDSQLLINHYFADRTFGLEGGVNLPSGKTKLSLDEFLTATVISQSIFGLTTPSFGQGLNYFLGLTLTHPLSDYVVIGGALSYQIKSEYQPLDLVPVDYKPSNEISATGGIDIKLSEFSTLTGDVTGIFYSSDELNGIKVFTAGNRFIFNTMYRHYFGFDALSINLLYRLIDLDKVEVLGNVLDFEKINPNQFYSAVSYFQKISSQFAINYNVFLSLFEKNAGPYSGYTMLGVRLSPEFRISPNVAIPLIFKYSTASADGKATLTNFDIGTGLKLVF